MTETCTTVSLCPADQNISKIGSSGVFLPGITAKVRKQDGTYAKSGEQGELIVKGPSNALYYLDDEKA